MVSSSVRDGRGSGTRARCFHSLELRLQVSVHEVDLLLPAKTLADVLRSDLADSVDGFQLAVGRGEQLLESSELADDPLDHQLRQSRNPPQDAESPGRCRIVEGVQLAVVAEQLGE